MIVKVGPRGQITIPKVLRESLGVKPGDSVVLTKIDDEVKLRPVTETIFDLVGSIPVDGPQDFDELREKARQHVAQKVLRELEDDQ